jgi:glyoxylase-like metal-dependent hydrolase (beta-lactamase superfamily II)
MESARSVHYFVTNEMKLDVAAIGTLLLNSGVHPDIPPEAMRVYGYHEQLEWPDGQVAPGVLQPILLWYVETPELKILVDTGCSKENAAHANEVFRSHGQTQRIETRPEHDIDAFLASHGTSASEIELVILSHLHLDHFCNAGAYTNARFLVQRRELAWGLAPPRYSQFHWREFAPYLTSVLDRVDALDGDAKICDGVEVWLVGGHTPGGMAVCVDKSVGKTVIAGDFFYTYRNIDFSWPPGSFSNIVEWESNCHMIKRKAGVILPSHDYELAQRHPSGTIA